MSGVRSNYMVDKKGRHSSRGTKRDPGDDLGLKLMQWWGRPSARLINLLDLMTKLKVRKVRTSSVVRSPALQKQTRLSEAKAKQLIVDYQTGRSVTVLSKKYKIHRTTVMDHLIRAGIPRRPQLRKMTEEQIREAVHLRAEGVTLAELSWRYRVDPGTVKKYVSDIQ